MASDNLMTRSSGLRKRLLAPYNGLKVTWFDNWHPALDEALQSLPELENCPHDLYHQLIQNSGPVRKKTALVTQQGAPVAIVGLRQKARFSWEPVTQWIIPGVLFPALSEYFMPVLESLMSEVWVAWWRMEGMPPTSELMRYLESTPTYRMRFSDDAEEYWRENGYFKTIRRMRNRCKDLSMSINLPGSTEWTINNWEKKWRANPAPMDPGLPDRLLAASYLEKQGQHYTISLSDQNEIIGGATMTVHQNDLVAGVLYYEPQYRKQGVGDRLIDLCFSFGAENGFDTFDIGGGHEYKQKWAPQHGERWWFNVCPEPLYRLKQLVNWTRGLGGKSIDHNSQPI